MALTRHIAFERLADFVEGRLPSAERSDVQAHVADCDICGPKADGLRTIIQLMRTDDAPAPPEHVVNRAIRMFRTERLPPHPGGAGTVRRRLMAALRFDSAAQSFAMGQRAGRTAERELLFEAEDNTLEVRIDRSEAGWTVEGQVLGACSGGEVCLENAATTATTSLNVLCEFKLPPVREGIYLLILRLHDVDVEVPGLTFPG